MLNNVIKNNEADVFVFTDSSDFYYEGQHYFLDNREINVSNNNSFRIGSKLKFVGHEEAKRIILAELRSLFGCSLKAIKIETPYDPRSHSKYKLFLDSGRQGAFPAMIIGQCRKVKRCHEMVIAHEKENGPYDALIKFRFDMVCGPTPLADYDMRLVYVPGVKGPIIYDWYAFGGRGAMSTYMDIYDNLGFTLEDPPVYVSECVECGRYLGQAPQKGTIRSCPCGGTKIRSEDISAAYEHHVYRALCDNGVDFAPSRSPSDVYRFRDPGADEPIKDVVGGLSAGAIKVITHAFNKDPHCSKFDTGEENA
jgi:hypothetical protein